MILSTRMSVRFADLYFDEPVRCPLEVDLIRYHQSANPIPGTLCTPFSTVVVDLTSSEDELLWKMKSHTRYKIRRGVERDELTYEFSNDGDPEMVARFSNHFDRCASLKRLPSVSRRWLGILAREGLLDLSSVRDTYGEMLAASSYLLTPTRVRGLYAGAAYRATSDHARRTQIGRANRLLYWQDMLRFKEAGVHIFDFGGYYTGTQDQEKLRINAFKLEFGGKVVPEFDCAMCATLRGKMALWAIQQRAKWLLRRRLHEEKSRTGGSLPASV
jgi:lipid II:glycine glycyltransferase (peptidoglycan interpeptide bridge formation enzyme)